MIKRGHKKVSQNFEKLQKKAEGQGQKLKLRDVLQERDVASFEEFGRIFYYIEPMNNFLCLS